VTVEPFPDSAIHGFLHQPAHPNGDALLLTHGAGANCQSELLLAVAAAFAETGVVVLRFDLPFRTLRPHGPPRPGSAEKDREGISYAVKRMRERTRGRIFLGGHSYGGRQATILASEARGRVNALLLLSYPLHPPRKAEQLRTGHFPKLTTPAFFVHGTRDPFASIAELESALALIPAQHGLMPVDSASHDLLPKKAGDLPARIVIEFLAFVGVVLRRPLAL
jgi:predicted alpha/beta-hydrolase family hydrolase